MVDVKHENVNGGMICRLTLDIIPEFEMSDSKNLSVDPINVVGTEQEVENEVRNRLSRYGKYQIAERKSKADDFFKVNCTGKFDDGNLVADTKTIPAIYGTETNT
jgi:FKBP-type peptidyl-prolyl cis-trans isomerase (trigger factor)